MINVTYMFYFFSKAAQAEAQIGIDSKKGDRHVPPSRQMGSRLTNTSQIEAVVPNYRENLMGMFAFSYIWAFGGHLHDR